MAEQDERLRLLEGRLSERQVPAIPTWLLATRAERADGGARSFGVTSGWVRLRVPLERAPTAASYRASLSLPEGRELYRADGITAVFEPDGTFVDVLVPGGLLPRGTYILSLTRLGPDGSQELGSYSLSVRPRAATTG